MLRRDQRLWRTAGVTALAVILGAAFLWRPEHSPLPSCLFRELTGLSCLTCGLTRSLHAMSHGEPLAATGFHLMGPVLFAAAVVTAGIWTIEAVRGNRIPLPPGAGRAFLAAGGMLWAGYWVTRLVMELA